MRTHKEGKMCSTSQTQKVIVIEDEAEILDLIASRKKKMVDSATQTENTAQRTTDSCSQTDRKYLQNSSDNKCIQSDPADLSAVSSKLHGLYSVYFKEEEGAVGCERRIEMGNFNYINPPCMNAVCYHCSC